MDFQSMATNELIENGLYKERDVQTIGYAAESVPYIETEALQAYELGFKRAMIMVHREFHENK